MTVERDNNGMSLVGTLDRYWTNRSGSKPKPLPNERLISLSHEHWVKYVIPTILYVLLTGSAIFLLLLAMDTAATPAAFFTLLLSGSFLLLCTHHWFFWLILAESQTCIIVTSKRVISIRQGLLWHEHMIDVAFDKMKTVEAHKKTLLQSVLNYGTLQFEPMVKINKVPHPGTVARQIEQAMGLI